MKKILKIAIIIPFLLMATSAYAITVSWNKNVIGQIFPPFATDYVSVGTTTPGLGQLTSASSTGPQLSLSSFGGFLQWVFRSIGGNLYFSTTTVAGTATTSISAFEIDGATGTTTIRGLNISGQASSTSNVGFKLSGGCFAGIDGVCLTTNTGSVTSVATDATLTGGPITTTGTLSLNLANQNNWTARQNFNANASSSIFSVQAGPLYIGGTATTTIVGNLGTSTFSSNISAVSASTTATSTMAGINLPYNGCFAIGGTCLSSGSGGATPAMSYSSTTGTVNATATTTVTAGKRIFVWGNGSFTCSGGQDQHYMRLKPPGYSDFNSFIIDNQVCGNANGRQEGLGMLGLWTASTTGDYVFRMDTTANNSSTQENFIFMVID